MLSYVSIIGGTVRVEKECTRVRERICVCTLYINWQVVIKCADLSTISSSSPAPVTHKRLQQSESSSPEDHQPSLYLYIPLFPSPPLYLFLSYPPPFSPCHSIPRLLSPLSPLIFLVTCCFSLIDQIPQYESLHLSFCLSPTKFYYFFTILIFRPFQSLYHSRSLYYILPSFFNFYQINKNGCFRWKNPDAVRK